MSIMSNRELTEAIEAISRQLHRRVIIDGTRREVIALQGKSRKVLEEQLDQLIYAQLLNAGIDSNSDNWAPLYQFDFLGQQEKEDELKVIPPEWQPIETAPKDNTGHLFGIRVDGKWLQQIAMFTSGVNHTTSRWWSCDECDWFFNTHIPTHWLRVPDPPCEQQGGG